ncbi:MAG: hypothetical protein OQK76_02470 [Gammaproteobacteria bacterium]|nr:hypothetical protein [Gammaproteobacteria bacterium]MCW8909464.1 hypothetical protein [Gammaproteobacteria bacterium]MCW9005656.1 hypothetical protein [Gammaproteobacteria bacterium]MCW9055031.1 hypothetical protein [Gammaproteobacteria bacterium]
MQSSLVKLINFSVNNWLHLYSLEQAVQKERQMSGGSLSIYGNLRNCELLDGQDLPVEIVFNRAVNAPRYESTNNEMIILGNITRAEDKVTSTIPVDEYIFEELRKNLMEYADIEGIHIIVTLGILLDDDHWPANKTVKLVKLDYAMKGDA